MSWPWILFFQEKNGFPGCLFLEIYVAVRFKNRPCVVLVVRLLTKIQLVPSEIRFVASLYGA